MQGEDSRKSTEDSQLSMWLAKLKGLYGDRHDDFARERPTLKEYLAALQEEVFARFEVAEPFSVGGTAVLFRVKREAFPKELVLKFNRPNLPDDERSMVENESTILPQLDHANIIPVLECGRINKVQPHLTFIVEPLVVGARTLEQYVIDSVDSVAKNGREDSEPVQRLSMLLVEIVSLLRQWVAGLNYVHEQGFVHLDVKPENVLVDKHGHLMLIDFGSIQRYDSKDNNSLTVYYTQRYAHPFLIAKKLKKTSSNRVKGGIKRSDLRFELDMYAMGISILELLNKIAAFKPHDVPQIPLFRSLHFLATRLLDGKNTEGHDLVEMPVARPLFGGLIGSDYRSLAYKNLNEVARDLDKEVGAWSPEHNTPELQAYSRQVIRVVPNLNTALTPRLQKLMEHPVFGRLKYTSQLGLISLLYPTADHTRYDHILGTFTYVCHYIRSLFNDSHNPIFRNLVDDHDIRSALLASLFHDLGQYPLAHDLEEVHPQIFKHPRISVDLLDRPEKNTDGDTLLDIIQDKERGWGVEKEWLKKVLDAHSRRLGIEGSVDVTDFKADLLSALIDGPLDADKADYISRDSERCGVPYGNQLDIDRLLHVLTVAVLAKGETHRVAIGIYEKGRASARAFGLARYLLFSSVYWHHTSRIMKSMLQYATAMALPREAFANPSGPLAQQIRSQLVEFVVSLRPPFTRVEIVGPANIPEKRPVPILQAPSDDVIGTILEIPKSDLETRSDWYPGIAWTDWLMLQWIVDLSQGQNRVRSLTNSLSTRRLYKRVVTLTRTPANMDLITRLVHLSWPQRVQLCEKIQARIATDIKRARPTVDTILPVADARIDELVEDNLAVIVDIPNPQDRLGFQKGRPLVVVPELREKSYYQEEESPSLDYEWAELLNKMMEASGPVRVVCHPELREAISAVFRPARERIVSIIEDGLRDLGV